MAAGKTYAIDNSAILYLAQMGPDHTNVYRFTATMASPVCPDLLQKAANRIYRRFPTIFAGFRPEWFSYRVVPVAQAPEVAEDPGLLRTMLPDEMERCACRIYYSGCEIHIEAFHALTDGYGAVAALRTLIAEYLYLCHHIDTPERTAMLENGEPDWETELHDSYLDHTAWKSAGVPNRHACQLKADRRDWNVKPYVERFQTQSLLKAARKQGVSLTAMLSGIMAEAIMELQHRQHSGGKIHPVRIMVPIDLRRKFPSATLRNFILYALPTMEPGEEKLPLQERLRNFHQQILHQTEIPFLGGQITRNVRLQQNPLFRMIPRSVKCAAFRTIYSFWGECNSSITLTNLGSVALSDALKPHIRGIDVHLTPRRQSPYNCGLISCGDTTSISISRFGAEPELEILFFEKLRHITSHD